MSGFAGNGPSGQGRASRFQFSATAGQTIFNGVDQNGLTLAYVPGYVEVTVNGVWLPPSDYTATDGSTIVLPNGCVPSDVVYAYALSIFSAADTFSKAQNGADVAAGFAANVGAVGFNAGQSLSDTQRAQARANVYASPFDALAYNNILINGGMEVDQEHVGSSGSTSYALDGWLANKSGTMVCTVQQVADAPLGFTNSLKVTIGTAEASLGASDYVLVSQPIEGFRTSKLSFGTANAASITLGFWTKIHRTGVYSGSIRNATLDRSYPFTFTQNVAGTWEYKTVTIPGDTTGTWIGNTNGIGLQVLFCVASGTTFTGTANGWAATNLVGATGTTNGVAATTDVFQITGVCLLPGTEAPSAARSPLIKRSFDQELVLCQRYYEKSYNYDIAPGTASTVGYDWTLAAIATQAGKSVTFATMKRTTPSVVTYSPISGASGQAYDYSMATDVAAFNSSTGLHGFACYVNKSNALTNVALQWTADARL